VADQRGMPELDPVIPTFPPPLPVSGLYRRWWFLFPPPPPFPGPGQVPGPGPIPGPDPVQGDGPPAPAEVVGKEEALAAIPAPPFPIFRIKELRLDVDGRYPQMVASGVFNLNLATPARWIANLIADVAGTWVGTIWYREGNTPLVAYTDVSITVVPYPRWFWLPIPPKATVTFSGGGLPNLVEQYTFVSPYFHPVEMEFDAATGITPETTYDTCDHPNRPANLPCETLSIETVFRRAGFNVSKSGGDDIVPLSGAGADAVWSDLEMHDAMQVYWSRFANIAQWSVWTFFAAQHELGSGLGGIMFDDIGPNHRQGTAIFYDSFISDEPAGDPDPQGFARRMRFWTAVHELGHAFNLAHSWQKSLQSPGPPWIPLVDEPEARSFMNYPFFVQGQDAAFFADFAYRFSDAELLFLRHAPEPFVEQGNADWFDNHGFRQASVAGVPRFRLELRVNREKPEFDFLEPQYVEMKLTNISPAPQVVDERLLSTLDATVLITKRRGRPARRLVPFVRFFLKPEPRLLGPGESLYGSHLVSAGRGGWNIDEPGWYLVQAAVRVGGEDVVSDPLYLRVTPPRGYDDEYLAQDFFRDGVARALSFGGTRVLQDVNNTLEEAAGRLEGRPVAQHARFALGNALSRDCKVLELDARDARPAPAGERGGRIAIEGADEQGAQANLEAALVDDAPASAETFGNIRYKRRVDRFSDWLADTGKPDQAADAQEACLRTLSDRNVPGGVLSGIERRRDQLRSDAGSSKPKRSRKRK
jgi:hypothetical protein